jgi:hypothetical protein
VKHSVWRSPVVLASFSFSSLQCCFITLGALRVFPKYGNHVF